MSTIAVLGCGKIGEALVSGLVKSGTAASDVIATNRNAQRGAELHERYGVKDEQDNTRAVERAKVIFLCVKPPQIVPLLNEISRALDDNDEDSIVVSMAAGVPIADMEEALPAGTPVIRCMPNTPMLLGAGMNAVVRGRYVNDDHLATVTELLSAVGEVLVLKESQIDAAGALSGSSPAYVFLMAEAMIEAGVEQGLARAEAEQLTISALAGAGAMLKESGEGPATLRANVSSPGGTTMAALREFEESGFRGMFFRAIEACTRKAAQLSKK
ncbi:pyrroline-5-carboxylate reductase [Corynebacterium poyangense]|uniref:Pyrroline-5-carboxylate reductase n=1 Tax=Corynebacterium poyangense TaxID=2684405 RepID=A0A7H0SLU3_9CORY|nr:pyrroline-5-carboxylate reductase [Corynebacterium poyangense]MBZ8177625.1 pyrroline-5-carboxylate reductase [Corynebacterium poyangense]QNQ89518.1 pyrroline-5-carboxylate reductase [Corynebacterium poyangense]